MLSKRIAVFLVMCILTFCLCGCGDNSEKYRTDIMSGQWIIPDDANGVCVFREDGSCVIDGIECSWKYKKNLLKNLRVDIYKDGKKTFELQVFEAEEQGYRYMMNLGILSQKKYIFEQDNAGYINLNHYEKVEINVENYEKYFMIEGRESGGEIKLVLKPEYEKRLKTSISNVVFDVVYGQADFFLTCESLAETGDGWGCVLKTIGIDSEDKSSNPSIIVGQAKGVLYFDMEYDSAFPVKE